VKQYLFTKLITNFVLVLIGETVGGLKRFEPSVQLSLDDSRD